MDKVKKLKIPICHPDRKHAAKDLCDKCYRHGRQLVIDPTKMKDYPQRRQLILETLQNGGNIKDIQIKLGISYMRAWKLTKIVLRLEGIQLQQFPTINVRGIQRPRGMRNVHGRPPNFMYDNKNPKERWLYKRILFTFQRPSRLKLQDVSIENRVSVAKNLFNHLKDKLPTFCPILNIPINYNETGFETSDGCASIDRIDSSKGYVPGNVAIISFRANTLKGQATAKEHRAIANYIDRQLSSEQPRPALVS